MAVAGLPTLTFLLRNNVDQQESWLFFAGSMGSLVVTLWFLVVLWKFPAFLRRVRSEGADAEVVVRLVDKVVLSPFWDWNLLFILFIKDGSFGT